jgi:hypothetical protein
VSGGAADVQADDFEHGVDRARGDSLKWNRYAGRDVLPLWVADMDFAAPPAIIAALERRVAHGCFGYAEPMPGAPTKPSSATCSASTAGTSRPTGCSGCPDW